MTITGRVTSMLTVENRPDLVACHVNAGISTGNFDCETVNVTLDGVVPEKASQVSAFVESRRVSATLVNPDESTRGTGFLKCERIALETILE